MRFTTRLILTAVLLATTATTASAGGRIGQAVQNVRGAVQEWRAERQAHRGGGSSCTTQTTTHQPQAVQFGGAGLYPQPQPVPVVMPQVGTVQVVPHQQYQQYTPIRLTSPVPVYPACVGGNCGR